MNYDIFILNPLISRIIFLLLLLKLPYNYVLCRYKYDFVKILVIFIFRMIELYYIHSNRKLFEYIFDK